MPFFSLSIFKLDAWKLDQVVALVKRSYAVRGFSGSAAREERFSVRIERICLGASWMPWCQLATGCSRRGVVYFKDCKREGSGWKLRGG